MRQRDTIGDGSREEEGGSYFGDLGQGSGSSQEGGMRGQIEEEIQKDVPEKDRHLQDKGNDSGLELVATRLPHYSVPPTTPKTESDSDLPSTEK